MKSFGRAEWNRGYQDKYLKQKNSCNQEKTTWQNFKRFQGDSIKRRSVERQKKNTTYVVVPLQTQQKRGQQVKRL